MEIFRASKNLIDFLWTHNFFRFEYSLVNWGYFFLYVGLQQIDAVDEDRFEEPCRVITTQRGQVPIGLIN